MSEASISSDSSADDIKTCNSFPYFPLVSDAQEGLWQSKALSIRLTLKAFLEEQGAFEAKAEETRISVRLKGRLLSAGRQKGTAPRRKFCETAGICVLCMTIWWPLQNCHVLSFAQF